MLLQGLVFRNLSALTLGLAAVVMVAPVAAGSQTPYQSPYPPPSQYEMRSHAHSGQNPTNTSLSSQDRDFMTMAAQANMLEQRLDSLAATNTQNSDVKDMAQRMTDDDRKVQDQLQSIASEKGFTLPTVLDATHQETYDRLSKLSGASFDKEFVNNEVTMHDRTVDLFRDESLKGLDPDLRNFADSMVIDMERHLQDAKNLQQTMMASASNVNPPTTTQRQKPSPEPTPSSKPENPPGNENAPETASNEPLLLAMGLIALATGLAVRRMARPDEN
jgi:putative membrane protein